MSADGREIHVPVYGLFTCRPAGQPEGEWEEAAQTPGPLTVRPGRVYRFDFHGIPDVRDEDFRRLVESAEGLTALTSLNLAGCPITDRGLRPLAELPWLESLTFHGMTDDGLRIAAKLTGLRTLNLEGSSVTDRGMAALAGLTKLKDLSLHACPIGHGGLKHISRLVELEGITLNGCPAITDRGIATLAALPNLRAIDLQGCWRITDRGIALLAGMSKLTYVGLCRASGFLGRLKKKFGVAGSTEEGAFGPRAVQALREAHPTCEVFQPVDWAALQS